MPDQFERKRFKKRAGTAPPDAWDYFYLDEIKLQCLFAIQSWGEIMSRLEEGSKDKNIWAFVHMLLVFAGNAAKLVFPRSNNSTARERGKRLRARLGIEELPPEGLAEARNYFEHFDERMDRYLGNTEGFLTSGLITPVTADEVQLDDGRRFRPHFLKLLQTNTMDLTIYDQTINLHRLYKDVELLLRATENALSKMDSNTTENDPKV